MQNLVLGGLRFLGIFLALCLLLEPLIKHVINRTEKPIIAVAMDNSQSVLARSHDSTELVQHLNRLVTAIESEGLEATTFTYNDSLSFSYPRTNLYSLLQEVEDEMEGRNWVGTVLFSDGIFNQGTSPLYKPSLVPQFLVGLGDTIPPRDINISRVLYNRITYKGNETPIRVEVSQNGFDNRRIELVLKENGVTLSQQQLTLEDQIQEVEFVVKSDEERLRKLTVSTAVLDDEFIPENNQSDLFIEVIDGRQKILIVANNPHPDVKAIREALSATDNYETAVYIPSLDQETPTEIYDVVIYHGAFSGPLSFEPKENPGIWYILNRQSSLNALNRALPFVTIQRRGSQPDNVTGVFNQSFSKFKLPDEERLMEDFPPIEVPFGEYKLNGPVESAIFQRVGSVSTKKPLLTFFDDGSQKRALLMGQNIWKWKLQEAAIDGSSRQFQDLISKTIQFLSVKNDKSRFRFQTRGNTFSNLEPIQFDSEVYNTIYERTYGNKISLTIRSEDGETTDFEFIDSEFKSSFNVPPLTSGLYTYTASVKMGEDSFSDRGQFLVEEINREYLSLAADHNLLMGMAKRTNGQYIHHSNIDLLMDEIVARDFKSIIRSSESFFPLLQSRWMLAIILLLFSFEWLLRKYWGGY